MRRIHLLLFALLLFGISSTAWATSIAIWNGPDQLIFTTQVSSPPPHVCCSVARDTGSFSGNFSIMFSGLGSIYPPSDPDPVFSLTIPIDVSLDIDYLPFDDHASACLVGSSLCYSSDTYYPYQHTYLLQIPPLLASYLQPIVIPFSFTTSVYAQPYETPYLSYGTYASATVTVEFGELVLKDRFGNDITNQISFNVTPPAGIATPEPASFVLAGAGLLALAIRRMRRPLTQN